MKTIYLIILHSLALEVFTQNTIKHDTWIQEKYIESIANKADTNSSDFYLYPIAGISKPFNDVGIMRVFSDEIKTISKPTIFNGKKVYELPQINSFLVGDYYTSKNIIDRNIVKGYVFKSKDKLVLQFAIKDKIIDEYYYVNHYKDYYFCDLWSALDILYEIKYKKK